MNAAPHHPPTSQGDEAIHSTCGEPSVVTGAAMALLAHVTLERLPCSGCRQDRPASEFVFRDGGGHEST